MEKIGRKTMIRHFEDLYKEHLNGQGAFDDFLRKCWDEALKNKEMINSA